ncbi:hypothetical protein GCM10025734_02860 [Kitasatospora paranensis]
MPPLLNAIRRIRRATGRPRHRPRQLFADRGNDYDTFRRMLWQRKRGIKPATPAEESRRAPAWAPSTR